MTANVFHKTFQQGIQVFFFVRQAGSFPLKTEQNRNMSMPPPPQQTFFVSILLFFLSPKCVEKYVWVYDICDQSLPFLSWLYEIAC